MTKKALKKTEQKPASVIPAFVFGLDENGKPRGAKFLQGLKDNIAAAAIDMKFNLVHDHSAEFTALGMKLPIGRIYGSGRSFIPPIRRDLYEKLKAAQSRPAERIEGGVPINIKSDKIGETVSDVELGIAIANNLPRDWQAIEPGNLIIAQSSHIEGWWEAIVVERAVDILTLRWRDYPDEGTVQRHVGTVALINPGTA
ncbi:hypothetical protein [Bradyrhizobium sp. URHD0069]|uniref:hypothetical protein n=1 Tax=Bradyrhizobium sp. URHD0069 TaxID=1380355 RepID=UPI000563E1F1|nr:hypothetical protein [Bradyrhizobium sp. URHD0069]